MDDERLLAEALRAHAAGGVSTPSGTPSGTPESDDRADEGHTQPAEGGSSRVGGRFRPLARGRRGGAPGTPGSPGSPGPSPGPPRSAGPPAPPVAPPSTPARGGPAPGAPVRPVPAPPTPATGSRPVPNPPQAPAAEPAGWTPSRVAWWSAVAVLGGGVLGALIAVISLAAPG